MSIPAPPPVISDDDDEAEFDEPIAPEPDDDEQTNVVNLPFQRPADIDKRAAEAAAFLTEKLGPADLAGFVKLMAAVDNDWPAVVDALETMRDIEHAATVH